MPPVPATPPNEERTPRTARDAPGTVLLRILVITVAIVGATILSVVVANATPPPGNGGARPPVETGSPGDAPDGGPGGPGPQFRSMNSR